MLKSTISRISLCALLLTGVCTINTNAQDKALLYKILGAGLTHPSYLYGTFHIVCPNDLIITDSTKKAINEAQQVYLELDLDDPAMMSGMMRAAMMTDGTTIKDYLSKEDYTILDNYLKQKTNMSLSQMEMMKPIGLMSMIYMGILNCQPASYDMTFMQMAQKDKKEIFGLESLDAQLAALNKIPMETQLKSLVDMARKPEEASKEFQDFLDAYKAHDLAKLMKQMKSSQYDGGMNGYESDLLDKRNASWIPVIEKAAQEKPTFFAFGAGHLGSENGVINLLRKKGYTVTPIQ
ncbi:TraB/GumN family protein [Spirosoma harenae]